jgi:hypothetical protein
MGTPLSVFEGLRQLQQGERRSHPIVDVAILLDQREQVFGVGNELRITWTQQHDTRSDAGKHTQLGCRIGCLRKCPIDAFRDQEPLLESLEGRPRRINRIEHCRGREQLAVHVVAGGKAVKCLPQCHAGLALIGMRMRDSAPVAQPGITPIRIGAANPGVELPMPAGTQHLRRLECEQGPGGRELLRVEARRDRGIRLTRFGHDRDRAAAQGGKRAGGNGLAPPLAQESGEQRVVLVSPLMFTVRGHYVASLHEQMPAVAALDRTRCVACLADRNRGARGKIRQHGSGQQDALRRRVQARKHLCRKVVEYVLNAVIAMRNVCCAALHVGQQYDPRGPPIDAPLQSAHGFAVIVTEGCGQGDRLVRGEL